MIVKKPYAFLIKHFKLIHLLLSILTIYIAFKSNNIFTFFNDYVTNGYYTYQNNLQNEYISGFMFIGVILIITLTSIIYLLFNVVIFAFAPKGAASITGIAIINARTTEINRFDIFPKVGSEGISVIWFYFVWSGFI